MVILYNKQTKEILYTEKETMIPQLPIGTVDEKVEILAKQKYCFVGVPYEMDLEVFNYVVCLDSENNFTGLQPKPMQGNRRTLNSRFFIT